MEARSAEKIAPKARKKEASIHGSAHLQGPRNATRLMSFLTRLQR